MRRPHDSNLAPTRVQCVPESQPRRRGPPLRHCLVVRCLCLQRGRVLLLRHRSGRPHGADFWALPGGLVEPSETIATAAVRELTEETGLRGRPIAVVAIQEFTNAPIVEIVVRCTGLSGRARLGSDPETPAGAAPRLQELRWWPLAALPALPGLQPNAWFARLGDAATGTRRKGRQPPHPWAEIPLPFAMQFD